MFTPMPKTASEWVARLNAGNVSAEEQDAFERWQSADPAHRSELAQARMAWFLAGKLDTSTSARHELNRLNAEAEPLSASRWYDTPRWVAGALSPSIAAIAVVLVVGLWTLHQRAGTDLPTLDNDASTATAVNEITSYVLPDGSTVTLNADSAVRIAFTRDEREVILERGEAFFDVQHDASKPFVVAAGPRKIAVTGTKFNVNSHEAAVSVAVVEGHVNVGVKADAHIPADALSAGDVILFPEGKPSVRQRLAPTQAAAWRSRQLFFDQSTLHEVLVEVNRYSQKRLVINDAGLTDLPLSGSDLTDFLYQS